MNVRLSRIPFSVLALSSALIAAGCGGDDNDPTPAPEQPGQGHLIGTVHGELTPYLMERLGLAHSFGGSAEELGDVVLFSAPEGLTASHSSLPLLKDAYEQGKVVALTDASEGEINVLLNFLGLDMVAPVTEDGAPVPLFAIVQGKGKAGIEGQVTLDCEAQKAATYDAPEDSPTNIQANEDEEPETLPPAPEEDLDAKQRVRADNFADWVAEAKARVQEAGVNDSPSKDLKELAAADRFTMDCSTDKQTFIITHTMWSAYSFDKDMDYYLIRESALLNPRKNWYWEGSHGEGLWPYNMDGTTKTQCKGKGRNNCRRIQYGHMAWYDFANRWREFVPANSDALGDNSPKNANKATNITSGFSFNLGGSVGLNGATPAGSLSAGVSWNNAETVQVLDVNVKNNSAPADAKDMARWRYIFDVPHQHEHDCVSSGFDETMSCWHVLYNAPELARNRFQPINQWYWSVPGKFSDDAQAKGKLRFRSGFTAVNYLSSESVANAIGIDLKKAYDYEWIRHDGAWWVPLSKPPRLAVSPGEVGFSEDGGRQFVTFVAGRNWKVASAPAWLTVRGNDGETSGEKTGANGITLHLVAEENSTKTRRGGTVTLSSSDGKHKQTIKVSQAPNPNGQ